MSKFKVIVARIMSGHKEGDIIELHNIDEETILYDDGFGGVYKRYGK